MQATSCLIYVAWLYGEVCREEADNKTPGTEYTSLRLHVSENKILHPTQTKPLSTYHKTHLSCICVSLCVCVAQETVLLGARVDSWWTKIAFRNTAFVFHLLFFFFCLTRNCENLFRSREWQMLTPDSFGWCPPTLARLSINTLCLCMKTATPHSAKGISATLVAAATSALCLFRGSAACPQKCFILWLLLLRREIRTALVADAAFQNDVLVPLYCPDSAARFLECEARRSAFWSAIKTTRKKTSATRGGVEAQWTSVSNLFKGNGAKKDCTYLRSEWCSVWIEGKAGWWISDPERKTECELFCNILLFCFACLSCWFHVLSLFIFPLRVAITSGSLETVTVTDCVCNTVKYNVLD